MRTYPVKALVLLVLLAGLTGTASADLSVEVGNGDKVDGTIGPTETETFLIDVPNGSKLTVTVKGKKSGKGTKPPVMSVEIRDSEGALVGGSTKSKAAKAKVTVEKTDTFSVNVTSGDSGNYQFKAKWKAPKKTKVELDLGDTPDEQKITFDADAGALATLKIKPAKGSAADPHFDRLDDDGGSTDLPDPAAGEKGHTLKKYAIDVFGLQCLFAANDGAAGGTKVSVTVKAPKSAKRKINLKDEVIGPDSGDDEGIGAIVTPTDGGMVVAGPDQGAIDGAAVDVPPGAVTEDTVVVVATAPELVPPAGEGLGPTVFFGPEGLDFGTPVTVQLPFDPAAVGGDFDDLEIYTRDEDGNISLVPGPYDLADAANGIISVQVSGFSSYVVAGPQAAPRKTFDLNGDGVDDLVIPAPLAGQNGEGQVLVFFGELNAGNTTLSSAADVVLTGAGADDEFGVRAAIRDLSGDGIGDLLVNDDGISAGRLHIFFGGVGFNPTGPGDADVTIDGESDIDDFGEPFLVGDVNDDQIPDLVVGAEGAGAVGKVYLFLGSVQGTWPNSATDADAIISGNRAGGLFGAGLALGDVDDSGRDDLIVGADAVDSISGPGTVYVFPDGEAEYTNTSRDATFRIDGPTALAGFGLDVRAGDVTGDQVDDIVANNGSDSVADHPGDVYVFEGGQAFAGGAADVIALRKYSGSGANDRFGFSVRLMPLAGFGEPLFIVASSLNYSAGRGGLFVFGGGGPLPPSGPVGSNTANVIGEGAGQSFAQLFDPISVGGVVTVVAGAPGFGQSAEGRMYLFVGAESNEADASQADIIITGLPGERIGGDAD